MCGTRPARDECLPCRHAGPRRAELKRLYDISARGEKQPYPHIKRKARANKNREVRKHEAPLKESGSSQRVPGLFVHIRIIGVLNDASARAFRKQRTYMNKNDRKPLDPRPPSLPLQPPRTHAAIHGNKSSRKNSAHSSHAMPCTESI